ncbi:hypothetical protein CMV30_00920 [Nibricoccus aquaticus]|uniref:GYF domain-containing protein n=1 Tax=Nibricoccus aquaticus TaxID=2576891 RepID=A0A290Q2A4_9BACT|nr:DUF4339 domain-containing protein [Nibricoccus aquaticus]ATC62644.1 hypothetical protein CMV30_00920 [Nibricoccus aquaticus]
MDWFYAEKDERKGPVSENEIASLIASRKIDRDTLVWNQTMSDWKPAGLTPLFPSAAKSPPQLPLSPGQHLCIITGKHFPESQMLKTEHGWVSVEGKDTYYQSIREGAPIPLADGLCNARAHGKYIVIPVVGGKLPLRCIKTNQPVPENLAKRKTLYWCTPWVFLAILANILILAVLYFILRKKVVVDIPLSADGQREVTFKKTIAWLTFFAGIATIIWGGATINSTSHGPIVFIAGFIILLASLVYGGRAAHALRVAKWKGGDAWLTGACPAFLASLPKYP